MEVNLCLASRKNLFVAKKASSASNPSALFPGWVCTQERSRTLRANQCQGVWGGQQSAPQPTTTKEKTKGSSSKKRGRDEEMDVDEDENPYDIFKEFSMGEKPKSTKGML